MIHLEKPGHKWRLEEVLRVENMKGKFCIKFTAIFLLALFINPPDLRAGALSPLLATAVPPSELVSSALKSDLELLGRWYGGPVYASAVSGDYVYFGTGGAVQVFKVKKANEQHGSSWQKVTTIETFGVVRGLAVSGQYIYVSDSSGVMRILDISKPNKPKERGQLELAGGLSIDGKYLYMARGREGIAVIDVSDPDQPQLLHANTSLGYIRDIHVAGSIALLADVDSGLKLVDISNPLQSKEIGHFELMGKPQAVYSSDQNAYVVTLERREGQNSGGLTIIDISDPTAPKFIGFQQLIFGAEDVWVEDSFAYLAGVANDAGLIIVDVSNPSEPTRLGSYTSLTCSETVTIAGSYAYLAHGDQGLEILDLSEPMGPTVAQHIDAAGHVRGVHVIGSLAYLANGYTGLRILDVSDPSAIRQIANLRTYRALDVHVSGSYAYLAEDWAG